MGACASKKKLVNASVHELHVEGTVKSSVPASTSVSVTTLEEQIERSRSHWSELANPSEALSPEEVATIKLDNEQVFKAWQSHPEWGYFFFGLDAFEELKVGEKFAEGAQAELFDVHVRWLNPLGNLVDFKDGRKWVAKVFKEGTLVRDLQLQWPHGLFQYKSKIKELLSLGKPPRIRFSSEVLCATLLADGRFAFIVVKDDEDLRSLIDRKMMESGHVGGGGPFSKLDAEKFMCQVALGIDQLHRYDIVHRDLKASNVLVYTKSRRTYCVVADYECSVGVVGTGYWRAPEILRACKVGNVKERPELFSKAADIYSLGMTFYEILTGKRPFQDEDVTRDLVIEGRQPHVPEFVDEWAQELLHWCWKPNYDARPSIEDVLGSLGANSSSEYISTILVYRREILAEELTSTSDICPS